MYEEWETLKNDCLKCTKCGLCETRTNVVFGYGNPLSEVMFIGEGPGEQEDLQGKPFVGRSGKLLDKMLAEIGLSREENIYIANIVKCRPPKNRDPLPEEQEMCIDWLRNQTALLNPKIIVAVGRIAAMKIIDDKIKITKDHGKFYKKKNILFMPTIHPAAVLRNPKQKVLVEEDFRNLKQKIEEICTSTYD
ncbi:MAG: uracil-DNA glycosylase [Clostridia bacterium]|nr:uracil-DNA glycosylase [Clostridia bacterium]